PGKRDTHNYLRGGRRAATGDYLAARATICLTPASCRAARVSTENCHLVSVKALVGVNDCSTSKNVAKFSAPSASARATTIVSSCTGSSATSFLTLRLTARLE